MEDEPAQELLRAQAPERLVAVGIDVQSGAYLDEVQLRYFAGVTADQVQPGDRIILCMGKEVESGRKRARSTPTGMWSTSSAR